MADEQNAPAQERHKKLEELYVQNYGYILDTALADRRLLSQDGERIAQSIAAHLDSYDGPLENQSFQQWAAEAIRPTVARLSTLIELRRQHRKSVLAGIWSVLGKNLDLKDHTSTLYIQEQIEADTWAWALEHLEDLLVPGTASLGTRLYAQGRLHALTWRKSRLRENARFDDIDVVRFGDEYFSAEDNALLFYDPGHNDDADDEQPVQRPKNRPISSPSDSLLTMKSGVPKLLCPSCEALQAICPAQVSDPCAVKLSCGHERPALLPASA